MPENTILIIEDDPGTAEAIVEKITSAGFRAIIKYTGAEGIMAFRDQAPDLIVLDLMLPDVDGIDICRAIRQESATPIIMLTAKAEEVDRIVGLEIGADDYMTKPFSPKELVSRIKAVLRRTTVRPVVNDATLFRAAGIELDDARHEVTVDGKPVNLTPTQYKLLALLMRNAGQVVSRDTLTTELWGYEGFSTNLLEVHIGHLRRKIEDNPRKPRRLITVRSFGYKITDSVSDSDSVSNSDDTSTSTATTTVTATVTAVTGT